MKLMLSAYIRKSLYICTNRVFISHNNYADKTQVTRRLYLYIYPFWSLKDMFGRLAGEGGTELFDRLLVSHHGNAALELVTRLATHVTEPLSLIRSF